MSIRGVPTVLTDTERRRQSTAPQWAKDLVIYELNPRTFTSPAGAGDGSGSGTFRSTAERLPYLADLGVNGIWMAGHHLATRHFYGVWSVYAAMDPAQLDPVLGSERDLRDLVDTAHSLGIRIFLDVIAHGVLHESPLVAEHPDWFDHSSWGMADFDYGHPGFRAWWRDLWVGYVERFGIDGFRIDVNMGDPELWDEIVETLRARGRDIVVFPEIERYHFSQQDNAGTPRDLYRDIHIADLAGRPRGLATAELSCHDYGWEGLPGNHLYLKGSRARAAYGAMLGPRIPLLFAGDEFDADPQPVPDLTQGLYGDGGPGGWLYGTRIDWSQLEDPARAAMHADVRSFLHLRAELPHLLHGDTSLVDIAAVPHDGQLSHVPYVLFAGERDALMIVADTGDHDRQVRLRPPWGKVFPHDAHVTVEDALTGAPITDYDGDIEIVVPADRRPGGGVRALRARLS
jgi:hypothetical protein